jgi:hypothetical protein
VEIRKILDLHDHRETFAEKSSTIGCDTPAFYQQQTQLASRSQKSPRPLNDKHGVYTGCLPGIINRSNGYCQAKDS